MTRYILTRILPGFALYWVAYTIHHWYIIDPFVTVIAAFGACDSTIFAAFFTLLALLFGLAFRRPPLARAWQRLGARSFWFSLVGALLLILHGGFYSKYWLPVHGPGSWAAWVWLLGVLLTGFPVIHWPQKRGAPENQSVVPGPV